MSRNQWFDIRRSVCLAMIGFISVAEATVPPIPKGIFSMPPWETNGYPDQILNDPRIVGLDLLGDWADIEATEGVYDWSSVDSELVKAEAHGKKVLLRIVSGGISVPDWLLADPNVQTFQFIDTNPYHSTYGQLLTIPVFWDPIFLDKKIALIQAAGAHFADHSNIEVVACAFANATSADWNIPDEPEDIQNWLAAGYTTQLMVNTGETTIDATMAAFPNQNVTLSIGLEPSGLNPDQYYLPETVVNYATTTYGRFIAQRNALAAFTPDPVDTSVLFTWQIVFDQCPNVAAQMLYYVSGDDTYRMNGGVAGDPLGILLSAIIIGTHYGTQYQEIYENDLKNPVLSPALDYANWALTQTWPSPAAPSNLNATPSDPWSVNLTWVDNANNELGYRIESKVGSNGTYQLVTTLGPNTATGTVTGLVEGTQYYFRLQGVNAGGRSDYSNEATVATLLTSPASLTAQALSSSQVLLTWTDRSATETGFRIERSQDTNTDYREIGLVGANETSFTDSALSEATTYWYRVRAYNADTTSDYSNEKQVTTLYDIPAPPSGLTITSVLTNRVSLSWTDNSNNETGFKIQRKEGVTGTYADIWTTGANMTSYTDRDTALRDGTLYYYRVAATNAAGDSAFSNEASGTTLLAKPTSATATAVSSSEIDLTWVDNSSSETGYKIERKRTSTGTFEEIAQVGANVQSYQNTNGLDPNTKYFYRVRATNGTINSDYSNSPSATTFLDRPAAPSNLAITSVQSNQVSLSWTDNSNNETGFKIQRKEGVTGTYADIWTTGANMTSYTDRDTALRDGTLYYYRVAATNAAGDSAFSNEASGTTPLAKPTSATATAVSSSEIDLTWVDNSSSETGYKIERKTGTGDYEQIAQVDANVQSYQDTNGLHPNTKYFYRIRATNGTINSDYSNSPSATTFLDPPVAPSNLTITSVSTNRISLSWNDNSNNETGFKIQRKTGTTGTYATITTTGHNVTTYNDSTVIDGTLYYYRVSATNGAGDSAFSNEANGITPLAAPTSATATAVSSSEIDLTWVDNSVSETGYKIERKRTSSGTFEQIAQVDANVQSYQDGGLDANTKYFYRVRATNGTIDSAYSNSPSATTFLDGPAAPSNLTITSLLTNRVSLSWTDNSNNETGFKIQRKTGSTGTYATITTTGPNVTVYNDSTVTDGTLYYYRVSATNGAGDSDFSNEASGTTLLAAPTSATATAVSSSEIDLTWVDNSVSETGYKIERKRTSSGTFEQIAQVDANVQSYQDTNGLDPNTKYFYQIRATNGTIDSDYSNSPSATTFLDPPVAPSNLTITSLLTNKVSLSWTDNSNNETGFKIQRKEGLTGTYVDIKTTAANVTSYTDQDPALKDGTLYYYRVCATNGAGDSDFSNEASGTTPLAKPTSLTATAVSSSEIDLTWIDNSVSETGYKIERRTGTTGDYAQIDQVDANVQSYHDSGLDSNTRYYYRVRATNGTIDSDYSNSPSAVTFR